MDFRRRTRQNLVRSVNFGIDSVAGWILLAYSTTALQSAPFSIVDISSVASCMALPTGIALQAYLLAEFFLTTANVGKFDFATMVTFQHSDTVAIWKRQAALLSPNH